MSAVLTDPAAAVKADAEQIVASGADVRPRLADAVARAACRAQQSGQGLVALVRAAADGAREGLARAVPADRDDALRQVVDALGDGLSQAALAGRLALQEAGSCSQHYAETDLARLRDDLTETRDLFADTVAQGLKSGKALTAAQVAAARAHARRVADHLRPAFAQVYDAIRQHPAVFAREGVLASVGAGRGAAGALFQAIGRMLQRAGDELRRGGPEN